MSKSVQLRNVTCKMQSTVGHALFLKELLKAHLERACSLVLYILP